MFLDPRFLLTYPPVPYGYLPLQLFSISFLCLLCRKQHISLRKMGITFICSSLLHFPSHAVEYIYICIIHCPPFLPNTCLGIRQHPFCFNLFLILSFRIISYILHEVLSSVASLWFSTSYQSSVLYGGEIIPVLHFWDIIFPSQTFDSFQHFLSHLTVQELLCFTQNFIFSLLQVHQSYFPFCSTSLFIIDLLLSFSLSTWPSPLLFAFRPVWMHHELISAFIDFNFNPERSTFVSSFVNVDTDFFCSLRTPDFF